MIFGLVILTVMIGALMPIQAGLNAELTRFLSHPYLGAFISFFTGAMALSVLVLWKGNPISEIRRIPEVSPHLLLGGVLGALFVASSIFLIPKLGATTMIGAFVTGQLLMSVLMDHYGLFGLPVNPISIPRIVGVFLLFAGLLLVVKKES